MTFPEKSTIFALMKNPSTEQKIEIAKELLQSFEVSAEWPDLSSFRDICDDYEIKPYKGLFSECLNIALAMWNEVKIETKNLIEV